MIALPVAAALQIGLVIANPVLVKRLQFHREHAGLTPIIRQIHNVHHVYIAGLLLVFAALSLAFPGELVAERGLGRGISILIAIFWGVRLGVQRFYYDPAFLRVNRAGDVFFTAVFAVLFVIYAAAAAGGLR
jgi:preprotein translocase subunit SecY